MKVSVCLATYNGSLYIRQQLDSIVRQLQLGDEVIVVDDASVDNTVSIIEGYDDPRIRIITNRANKGVIEAFESALSMATGDFIFLSDQDDVWADNKVSTILDYFKMCNCDVIVSDLYIMDASGKLTSQSFYQYRKVVGGSGILKNIYRNTYIGCAMAFRRRVLAHALPFPRQIPMHDVWIGIIGEIYGRSLFITDKLVYYRRHSSNASSKDRANFIQITKWRCHLCLSLLKRVLFNV